MTFDLLKKYLIEEIFLCLTEENRMEKWEKEEALICDFVEELNKGENNQFFLDGLKQKDYYEKYKLIIVKHPQKKLILAFFYSKDFSVDKNVLGGCCHKGIISDGYFIFLNLFHINSLCDKNCFSENLIFLSENLKRNCILSCSLHHEIAHLFFLEKFKSFKNYLDFSEKEGSLEKEKSEEEYNSLLSELYAYLKINKIIIQNKKDFNKFLYFLKNSKVAFDKNLYRRVLFF